MESNKRFLVALSFPGEHREFVQKVAQLLSRELGQSRVLYDKFHEAEFARPNLDTHLQALYHAESELVVVFLCADYERKEWPGLEWRVIRDLIKKRASSTIMPIRLDNANVPGFLSIDGYIDAVNRTPADIAELIKGRLRIPEIEPQPPRPSGLILAQGQEEAPSTLPIAPPAPPARPTKPGVDELPHLWITTNHSVPDVPLVPVDENERAGIVSICLRYYLNYIPRPKAVERLSHATGARVYRVTDWDSAKQPILLKFSKRFRSDAEMGKLMQLHQRVYDSGVFLFEYARGLVALSTQSEKQWEGCTLEGEPFFVHAYPFLQGIATGEVKHFAGETLEEVGSVARKFAAVNSVLREIPVELVPKGDTTYHLDKELWNKVVAELRKAPEPVERRSRYLGRAELELITKTMRQVELLKISKGTLCLNDLHPHNVFMAGHECVLIFDYEAARTNWPEVASCSFALHRFCREHVRQKVRSFTGVDAKALVKEASQVFLLAYAGKRKGFVKAVQGEGLLWAKAVNFAKLMNNVAYELDLKEDPARRSEIEHWQEIVKFISYLKELDVFGVS